jgi:hypothetical protein
MGSVSHEDRAIWTGLELCWRSSRSNVDGVFVESRRISKLQKFLQQKDAKAYPSSQNFEHTTTPEQLLASSTP